MRMAAAIRIVLVIIISVGGQVVNRAYGKPAKAVSLTMFSCITVTVMNGSRLQFVSSRSI